MQDKGLVSIIMPTWACAKYIADSIRSVQEQTYHNWELLIQDDSSTDGTDKVVMPFLKLDKRIKYECNLKNSGAAVTRNNALRRAKGKWIAFLDADDLWLPEKLERQLNFMVENGYKFSYTNYQEINENSLNTGVLVRGPRHITKLGMFAFCWPGCLTVMYDRESLGIIQTADIKKNNDYAMWLVLCRKSDCYQLNDVLAKYRRGRVGSISTHGYITMIRWHFCLWHEAEGKNVVISLFWTCINVFCGIFKKVVYVNQIK